MADDRPTRFDRDTEVRPIGEGRFEGRIDPGWWIHRGPNGGYLAAILLRALACAVDDSTRAPRSLTIHYTRPPREGPVAIETSIERTGRSLATVTGRMLQDGELTALAMAAFSREWKGPEFQHAAMPEVPPPEQCDPLPSRGTTSLRDRYRYRWCVGDLPGAGSERAIFGGWIRGEEPRLADAPLVAAITDASPPACFTWASDPSQIGVPTVDLTIHFRTALPLADATPDDWLLAVFQTRVARQGFIEEDGEVWSRDGLLVAQSRQLAVIQGPRGSPQGGK